MRPAGGPTQVRSGDRYASGTRRSCSPELLAGERGESSGRAQRSEGVAERPVEHVGRRVGAFLDDLFGQLDRVSVAGADLEPGLLLEQLEQRLGEVPVARVDGEGVAGSRPATAWSSGTARSRSALLSPVHAAAVIASVAARASSPSSSLIGARRDQSAMFVFSSMAGGDRGCGQR